MSKSLFKSIVRAINDWANPEDRSEIDAHRAAVEAYGEAERSRRALPRSPVSTHVVNDLKDFRVEGGMFCFSITNDTAVAELNHDARVDLMSSLRNTIDRIVDQDIRRKTPTPDPEPIEAAPVLVSKGKKAKATKP